MTGKKPYQPEAPPKHENHPSADQFSAKWWVLLAVGVGTFMSALDGSVVNTILPLIKTAFHTRVATVEWVVTVYLLVVSGVLLSFGRLGDMRGHKPVYVSGFLIFVLSSALCGMAPFAWWLVAFRGLQAIGAAMIYANSPAILTKNFPSSQRGQALGLQATMTYLGLTAGPSLGGFLAKQIGWRSVFYINVPVGIVALWLSLRFIPREAPSGRREHFDIAGAGAFTIGLVALLLALNQGHAWGWGSAPVLALAAGSVLLVGVFLFVENTTTQPMLDLSLFSNWLFAAAAGSAVLNYVCTSAMLFVLPFYLIWGRGLNAEQAGLILSAQPLVMAVTAPLSGTLSDRIGSRIPATAGMGVLGVALALLARLGPTSPISHVIIGLALSGLGSGLFTSPNNSALMGAAPRRRQGIAAGVLALARNAGMALGVGLAGAIFTTVFSPSPSAAAGAALFAATRASFVATAFVAAAGALMSLVRGREAEDWVQAPKAG